MPAENLWEVMRRQTARGDFKLPPPIEPANQFYTLLTNSAGDANMNVNADASSIPYTFVSNSGFISIIYQQIMTILDKPIIPTNFGGISGSLGTGLLINAVDTDLTTVLIDYSPGAAVMNNADFHLLSGTTPIIDAGAANDMLTLKWTMMDGGAPLVLRGNQALQWTVQDSLGAITSMRVCAQGLTFPDNVD